MSKKIIFLIATLAIFIIVPATVLAFQDNGQLIKVNQDEVVDGNFINAGNSIEILGAINGDVVVVGRDVVISGSVAGDVFALANNIKISGTVLGSVRAVGDDIQITGKIQNNVNILATTLILTDTAEIGWDFVGLVRQAEIRGKVLGNVSVTASKIAIANEVGKNLNLNLGVSGQAVLEPTAKVVGDFTYQSGKSENLKIDPSALILGKTKKDEAVPRRFDSRYFFDKLVSLFGLMVIGLLLITIVPKFVMQVGVEMKKSPGIKIAWALVYIITTPLVILLLFISIIGLPLGLMLIPLYLIFILLAKTIVGIIFGLVVFSFFTKGAYKGSLVWPMVAGLVLLDLIFNLPIIGLPICLIAILWALGAMINVTKTILTDLR